MKWGTVLAQAAVKFQIISNLMVNKKVLVSHAFICYRLGGKREISNVPPFLLLNMALTGVLATLLYKSGNPIDRRCF
jgi:hypothetical protein